MSSSSTRSYSIAGGHHKKTIGRRLISRPQLWQDWDDQAEEGAAQYWELFTDLLLVACASALADRLKENFDFWEFAIQYCIILSGWWLYTHHITSRFQEASLMHSFFLFFFLLAMAAQVVNIKRPRFFSLAAILQRVAVMTMLIPVAIYVERARAFAWKLAVMIFISIVCLLVAAVYTDSYMSVWIATCIVDLTTEAILTVWLPGNQLVPINIEHTKERLGVLVLVMLGETVISATLFNNENDDKSTSRFNYYVVLALSFLLIYMLTLLFFNMQPEPKDHALRRSRATGVLLLLFNKALGLGLLSVGVSIKLFVEREAEEDDEGEDEANGFACRLLGLAVGGSMVVLYGIRICHYAGRLPRPHDPPQVRRLMYIWWTMFGLFSVAPLCLIGVTQEPIVALSVYSILLMVLCVVETTFTHILEDYLEDDEDVIVSGERSSLLAGQQKASYS